MKLWMKGCLSQFSLATDNWPATHCNTLFAVVQTSIVWEPQPSNTATCTSTQAPTMPTTIQLILAFKYLKFTAAIQKPPNMGISKRFFCRACQCYFRVESQQMPYCVWSECQPTIEYVTYYIESTTVQLVVPYNMVHNVSVSATVCGYGHGKIIDTYMLSYG